MRHWIRFPRRRDSSQDHFSFSAKFGILAADCGAHQIFAILIYKRQNSCLCSGLNCRDIAGNPVTMLEAILRRVLFAILALTLVGGTMIQSAFPALASPTSHATTGDSAPCDHMRMVQQNGTQADQPMPCNSMPCKGSQSDCLQMCMGACITVAIANLSSAPATPSLVHWVVGWSQAIAGAGLSIRPDPFPPKRLISA